MRTSDAAGPRSDQCTPLGLCASWGRFWFHYGLLGLIMLAIALASVLAFAFHKLHVPLKGFGEGEFKPVTVGSQAVSIFNFFIFLLYPGLCKRCISMFMCNPVIGPDGLSFFLGIDMSMTCSGYIFALDSSVGSAAMVLGAVTIIIPLCAADRGLRVPDAVRAHSQSTHALSLFRGTDLWMAIHAFISVLC